MLDADHPRFSSTVASRFRLGASNYTQVNSAGGSARLAFTLVEIMVVLAILTALMAMGFGGYKHLRDNADRDATRAVVESVANAIAARGTEMTIQSGSIVSTVAIWDVDKDGIVDGSQFDLAGKPNETGLRDAGYAGLTSEVVDLPPRFRDSAGLPIDAWQNPLRYAYAPNRRGPSVGDTYVRNVNDLFSAYMSGTLPHAQLLEHLGAKGFVVWSDGPDGISFTADDIISGP